MINELYNMDMLTVVIKTFWNAPMGYNTILFWMCLMLFIPVYVMLTKPVARKYLVLLASLMFYIWNGSRATIIIVGTGIIVYIASRMIERVYTEFEENNTDLSPKEQVALFAGYKKKAVKYLWLALLLIIGMWVYVKGIKLLDPSIVLKIADRTNWFGAIVPLGISYYTLSAVGYLLDVYWRKTKPEHNFINLFSAMIYFPHIVQGPISKYSNIIKQMTELQRPSYNQVCYGLQLMLWGYIKKLIIADRLALYINVVFAEPTVYAGVEVLIAILLCTVQLYADFSGCMDIVRGISQVIGIDLEQNFRQPFFSKSAQEFWTRWHITLGAWTKDYIYMPIAMNTKFMKYTRTLKKNGKPWLSSFIKAFCPLILVWSFTGLWHGTGWDYIVWGLYWCAIMTIAKETKPIGDKLIVGFKIEKERTYYQVWMMIRTVMLFGIGRTITVTGSLVGCVTLWRQLFTEHRLWTLFDGSLYTHGLDQKDFYVALVGMGIMLMVDIFHERGTAIREVIARQILPIRWFIYYIAAMSVIILGMYGPSFDAASFVYGAF